MARAQTGSGKLLRVFVDEGDRYAGRPAFVALIEALREAGFTGATVFKGIEGFGARRTVHSTRVVDYTADLPVLIEVVEEEQKIRDFLPRLQTIVRDGLITVEHLTLIELAEEAVP